MNHLSPTMNRRQFNTLTGSAMIAALTGTFANGQNSTNSYVPRLGAQARLNVAPQIKEAGAEFIAESVARFLDPEIPESEFQTKLRLLGESPLEMYSCNSFIRRKDLHCTGPDANHDEVITFARSVFKRARQANVNFITFGSGGSRRLPEGFSQERGMDQFVALLKLMGPAAEEFGITVAVEPLQQRECNFITRISQVEEVVRRADHSAIRGTADFYHMAAEGDTPEQLAKAMDIIVHLEIAELVDRQLPGKTGQDFRPFFKVMKEANYQGAISIEARWEIEDLHKGFEALRTQWLES